MVNTRKSHNFKAKQREKDVSRNVPKLTIMPKNLVQSEANDGHKVMIKLCTARDSNGEQFLFDIHHSSLYQFHQFAEPPHSWFVDDFAYQDGSVTLVTPMDPLFVVLPYLRQCSKYRPLDQILVDGKFPDCATLVKCQKLQQSMSCIADIKETEDWTVYCYSEIKCIKWLSQKVNVLAKILEKKGIHVSCGAQAATFVRNKKDICISEEDYVKYACNLISDYLPEDISELLLKSFGFTATTTKEKLKEQVEDEPAAKRQKLDVQDDPIEDYSKLEKSPRKKTGPKKLTAMQKALTKVDKTGMKNISSFFNKK